MIGRNYWVVLNHELLRGPLFQAVEKQVRAEIAKLIEERKNLVQQRIDSKSGAIAL